MPKVLISAGEASGDNYGALLMEALQKAAPRDDFACFGLGGAKMQALDLVSHFATAQLGGVVVGTAPVQSASTLQGRCPRRARES